MRNSGSVSIAIEKNKDYWFATDGKSWAVIHNHMPDLLSKLVVRGAVFSRMNPDQKQQLIVELQSLGYYVGEY